MSAHLRPLLSSLLLALGCHASTSDAPSPSPDASAASDPSSPQDPAPAPSVPPPKAGTPPGPPENQVGADELHRLEGQPESALLDELGEPGQKREFEMGECCNEFEIELYNTYPPDGGHEAVVIREWTWDYDGYALTVWLHQRDGAWVVLETSRYSDDVEF